MEDVVRIFLVNAGERKICKSRCSVFVKSVGGESHASKKEDGSEKFHGGRIKHSGDSSKKMLNGIAVQHSIFNLKS
jgi:hypothetical protein